MSTTNLFSALIGLRPVAAGSVPVHAGHLAHAAFLDLVRQADPTMSQALHDTNGRKPFTLSTLIAPPGDMQERAGIIRLQPDHSYQLRLTSLNAALFDTFLSRFLSLDGANIAVRLGDARLAVTRIHATTQGEWVGHSSFAALGAASRQTSWSFQFASPTAFSKGEQEWGGRMFSLFPEPGDVFDSLAASWRAFAPPDLDPIDPKALRDFVTGRVVVSHYALHTTAVQFARHQQLGFIGTAHYRLMDKHAPPEMVATLNRLAAFALYAGIGYKTTMGMGQVRCSSLAVPPPS